MIFAISKFIAGLFGLDISRVQRWVFWAFLAAVVLIVLILGLWLKSCFNKPPKLNQVEIQKAQQAIATQDRHEMIEVLAQSDAREKTADATAVNANNATVDAINESKKQWANASNDEMAAELERRAKESQ